MVKAVGAAMVRFGCHAGVAVFTAEVDATRPARLSRRDSSGRGGHVVVQSDPSCRRLGPAGVCLLASI